jgi:ComF family protein
MLSYNDIIDFLYPRICILTDKRLSAANSNNYADDEVLARLPNINESLKRELMLKVKASHVLALYSFDASNDVRVLLHNLKYSGMKGLGVFLGEILARQMLQKFARTVYQYDYIIPVPLHPVKIRERGYNQSAYLCRGIKKQIELDVIEDLLMRVKNTKSQTKLDKRERMENMKGAFMVNPIHKDLVKGKSFIVVDDVLTTGATMNEVINTLKKEGADRVFAVTFAMANH